MSTELPVLAEITGAATRAAATRIAHEFLNGPDRKWRDHRLACAVWKAVDTYHPPTLPPKSHTGRVKCPACSSINQFRSDFKYAVGEWVLGLRCAVCLGSTAGQPVVELTERLDPVAK